MAVVIYQPMLHANKDVVVISGSFEPEGTGAPTIVTGRGYSVARVSQSKYKITFDWTYPHFLYFNAFASLDTADALLCRGDNTSGSLYVSSDSSISFDVVTADDNTLATELDTDSGGALVSFVAMFQRSSIAAK